MTSDLARARHVFDFDGVLTTTDSTAGWLAPRFRSHPATLAGCLPWLTGFLLSTRAPSARTWFTRRLLEGALARDDLADLVTELREAGRDLALDDRRTRTEAVERLTSLLSAGHEVAIVSAGLEPLLEGWRTELGLDVPVLASRLSARDGRIRLSDHCFATRKIRRLEIELGWTSWQRVYTDSSHDLPLMRGAETIALVQASERTCRRARALDRPVEMLAWT